MVYHLGLMQTAQTRQKLALTKDSVDEKESIKSFKSSRSLSKKAIMSARGLGKRSSKSSEVMERGRLARGPRNFAQYFIAHVGKTGDMFNMISNLTSNGAPKTLHYQRRLRTQS